MGTYKNKAYTLRLDNDIMEKVRYIAEKEDRPLSKQLERIIKQYVDNYEDNNGTIINKSVNIDNGSINNGNISLH